MRIVDNVIHAYSLVHKPLNAYEIASLYANSSASTPEGVLVRRVLRESHADIVEFLLSFGPICDEGDLDAQTLCLKCSKTLSVGRLISLSPELIELLCTETIQQCHDAWRKDKTHSHELRTQRQWLENNYNVAMSFVDYISTMFRYAAAGALVVGVTILVITFTCFFYVCCNCCKEKKYTTY